jgi:hypothetical protein
MLTVTMCVPSVTIVVFFFLTTLFFLFFKLTISVWTLSLWTKYHREEIAQASQQVVCWACRPILMCHAMEDSAPNLLFGSGISKLWEELGSQGLGRPYAKAKLLA